MRIVSIIAICILLFNSCKKKNDESEVLDTQKPIVESIVFNDGFPILRTNSLSLNATFKDNKALKNCIISIRFVSELKSTKGIDDPWIVAVRETEHLITFSGEQQKNIEIEMLFDQRIEAACREGVYVVKFKIEDSSGNINSDTQVNIDIL